MISESIKTSLDGNDGILVLGDFSASISDHFSPLLSYQLTVNFFDQFSTIELQTSYFLHHRLGIVTLLLVGVTCWFSLVYFWQRQAAAGNKSVLAARGVLPHKKDGDARQKYWKELLKGTKILFCRPDLRYFSLRRGTSNKTQPPLIFFHPNTLKGTPKSSYWGTFQAEHLKRYLK